MCDKKTVKEILLTYPCVHDAYQEAWDADKYMIENKMFAFIGCNKIGTPILTLKMQPQEAAYYRENYELIEEGYYMNKIHWISIIYEQMDQALIQDLIDKSYHHFVSTLPKKMQQIITGEK